MTGPIAIDTPDYQRGIVSAQKLLATVPAGTDHVTVGVPPNAETLIVTASNVGTNPTVYAQGTGTLYKFPGKLAIQQPFITSAPTWFFDVSQSVDPSVLIQFSAAPGDEWYVYADSAAHLVVDPSRLVDGYGQQYVIPSVPSAQAGDHPPNELQLVHASNNIPITLLPAPGVGQRYRIFAAYLTSNTPGNPVQVFDSGSGQPFLACMGEGSNSITLPPQGYPCTGNASIGVNFPLSATAYTVGLYYTTETI